MAFRKALVAAAAVVPAVLAQQTVYGQCGGIGWSGPTTCTSGNFCSQLNAYYFQCLPGAAPGTTPAAPGTTPASTPASTPATKPATTPATTPVGSSPTAVAGNPFAGKQIYANPYYSSEIHSLAIPSLTGTLAAKATAVAEVGTFVWLDSAAKVPTMDTYLTNIEALNKAGASPEVIGAFVVYDLPDRDCAAAASNGEYTIADNGVANYKAYIDSITAIVKNHPTTTIALVIEPDSLANLVTNLNVAECAAAQSAYIECVTYAIQQLNIPNVSMYLDAGHAGWLGWSANIGPAAQLFTSLWENAGKPAAVRGLATNVANYNAWTGACASYTQGDSNCNEELYVNALAPLLSSSGFPAHFIMDTSRNGVQPTSQLAWGDWCNVINTGFGVRPTTNTGNVLEDAFVWIKPGGECDGTSNSTAPRFDYHCALADALQPSPQAGTWFQAYFQQLLQNANPSF
jgi:cellulose 1,4-beta-cellobiosidase